MFSVVSSSALGRVKIGIGRVVRLHWLRPVGSPLGVRSTASPQGAWAIRRSTRECALDPRICSSAHCSACEFGAGADLRDREATPPSSAGSARDRRNPPQRQSRSQKGNMWPQSELRALIVGRTPALDLCAPSACRRPNAQTPQAHATHTCGVPPPSCERPKGLLREALRMASSQLPKRRVLRDLVDAPRD